LVEFPQDLDGVSAYSSHEIEELDAIDSAFNLTMRALFGGLIFC
jgi:hypothetical protein